MFFVRFPGNIPEARCLFRKQKKHFLRLFRSRFVDILHPKRVYLSVCVCVCLGAFVSHICPVQNGPLLIINQKVSHTCAQGWGDTFANATTVEDNVSSCSVLKVRTILHPYSCRCCKSLTKIRHLHSLVTMQHGTQHHHQHAHKLSLWALLNTKWPLLDF